MTTESTVIPNVVASDWIILNIQQVGYYKVDYSRDIWTTIIDGYKKSPESIHKINREVLHEEMFDGWVNLRTQSISDCLGLLGVLHGERDGGVWEKAGNYIEKLNEFFLFSDFYDEFLDLLHIQLTPHLNADESSKLSREITRWCRESQLGSYLQSQLEQLLRYMNTNDFNDKPDFCSAFRVANSSVYQHFFDKVFNESFLFDSELISALGCTESSEKLHELFTKLLAKDNKINEFIVTQTIYSTMRNSEAGLEAIMDISFNQSEAISQM